MYYDYNRILSFGALISMIIGERGVGKTYGATDLVTSDFLKKQREFIYLRRYKTELKTSVPKFFDAINTLEKYKNTKFTIKGNNFYINDKIAGYGIALSTSNILKSTTFDKVYTIIFDEFIIDKGNYHYLCNEVEKFLDLLETIGRLRNIRVICLGNALSITNPYFLYFDLHLPYNSDIATFKNGTILVNYVKNEKYREFKKQTRFGKLIENTSYGKYAIDNEFLRDSKSFICKRTKDSKFCFILYMNGFKYGIWTDKTNMYISEKLDTSCPIKLTINSDDHNNDTILLRIKTSPFLQGMLEHYRLGTLGFENQKIKNNVMQFIIKHIQY